MTATLELARQLLGFNTINPPGSEADCMRFFADWLDDSGFEVSLSSFGEGRCNLIASLPGAKSGKPLAFTGHLDTVPLGNGRWQYDPFGSQMEDGRLYETRIQRYESGDSGVCRRLRSSAGSDPRRTRRGIADNRRRRDRLRRRAGADRLRNVAGGGRADRR